MCNTEDDRLARILDDLAVDTCTVCGGKIVREGVTWSTRRNEEGSVLEIICLQCGTVVWIAISKAAIHNFTELLDELENADGTTYFLE